MYDSPNYLKVAFAFPCTVPRILLRVKQGPHATFCLTRYVLHRPNCAGKTIQAKRCDSGNSSAVQFFLFSFAESWRKCNFCNFFVKRNQIRHL